MAWGQLGTLGWVSGRLSCSDCLASPVSQSYCLKVKEMDDEEYSCIVSTKGLGAGPGVAQAWEDSHTFPSFS
jgi:hypothetical protein